MNRTSSLSRLIFPALLAVVPACKDDAKCISLQLECRGVCVDTTTNPDNCGACGNVCGTGESCVASACEADCEAPQEVCGGVCTDTQTSAAHCGDCTTVCAVNGECVAGACENPLAILQTSFMDGTEGRGLYMLEDGSFELTQLDRTSLPNGGVIDHAILPNGDVLLVGALDTADKTELYRVSARGGTPVKLNAPLVAGGNVEPGLVVSADGTKVLYRADGDVTDQIDLYQVALANPGAAVRVNGPTQEGGNVTRVVELSTDGRRVAYVADADIDELFEAYTVDLSAATPGAAVKLGGGGTPIWDLHLSRDGSHVVARGSFGPTLAVVAIADPTTFEPVSNSDGGEGYVEDYQLADDGSVVYYTYARNFLHDSLWVAPVTGTVHDSTRLVDGTGDAADNGMVRSFLLLPNQTQIVFRQTENTTGIERLFRIDIADPVPSKTLLSSGGPDSDDVVTDFAISRDGGSLAFRGGADGAEGGNPLPHTQPPNVVEHAPALYFVDLHPTGLGPPRLLTPGLGKQNGIDGGYVIGNDRRVLLRADYDTGGFSDAYLTSPATPGTLRKVSPPLDNSTDATDVSLITLF